MKIQDITQFLDGVANPALQESYDNAGLIVGNKDSECTGILVTLDTIPEIVDEAIEKKCNLIVSHHPIIFRGLKKITGKNYVERTVIKAIKKDIAIYAIHTNLDNLAEGVNSMLAKLFGLKDCRALSPKENMLRKLVTFVPVAHAEDVRKALFAAGAGGIGNYNECSFNVTGSGTFKAMPGAHPYVGEINERHWEEEVRVEVIYPVYKESELIKNLKSVHPYEEVAYYIQSLENTFSGIGSGLFGEMEEEMDEKTFLGMVKDRLKAKVIRHTRLLNRPVKKVAVCGGSGFFLLPEAKSVGADVYITADVKYHEFFDADGDIVLIDAGHFETEQFTIELLADILQKNFPNFAVQKTGHSTNPVSYFI